MAFRSAPISHDGNRTFLDVPTATIQQQADPIMSGSTDLQTRLSLSGLTCKRRQELDRRYRLSSFEGEGFNWREREGPQSFAAELPDSMHVQVPHALSRNAKLAFGCDFRGIGGPFRSLTIEFRDAECVRWLCEDYMN
mmetsp:Transcript_50118/g.145331  ORF Transcript_50118/g.145331 Transcript_50118/m.145331 type:complete len:138 (+) Transcript_50118:3-416(+)